MATGAFLDLRVWWLDQLNIPSTFKIQKDLDLEAASVVRIVKGLFLDILWLLVAIEPNHWSSWALSLFSLQPLIARHATDPHSSSLPGSNWFVDFPGFTPPRHICNISIHFGATCMKDISWGQSSMEGTWHKSRSLPITLSCLVRSLSFGQLPGIPAELSTWGNPSIFWVVFSLQIKEAPLCLGSLKIPKR